jgi:N-acetylmuramoyl-L-alanine amidase
VLVGDLGGVAALADAVAHALHHAGAVVEVTSHPDGSIQAHQANDVGAEVYLGLTIGEPPRCAYYATNGFTSEGGLRLATLLAEEVGAPTALDEDVTVSPMRVPVLRETRMPAVVCGLAPPRRVVERGAPLADAVAAALSAWVADPLPRP